MTSKLRYHTDPEYREHVKERSRIRHKKLMLTSPAYVEKQRQRLELLKAKHRDPLKPKQRSPDHMRLWKPRIRAELKIEVYNALGPYCACCGETEERFLTIDHIEGGGSKHRDLLKRRTELLYMSIKKAGFPKDKYRILCMNCNWATKPGKPCPHEIQRGALRAM
jgi:hypothetical protein